MVEYHHCGCLTQDPLDYGMEVLQIRSEEVQHVSSLIVVTQMCDQIK